MSVCKLRIDTAKELVSRMEATGITLSAIYDISPTNDVYDVYMMADDIFAITGKAGLDSDGV